MRLKNFLLFGSAALLLVPNTGTTQFPGGYSRGPGGSSPWGGRGGSSFSSDPNERWNSYTGGRPVWNRAEITDPSMQRRFDFMAQMMGVTNGQITKDQFLAFSSQMSSRFGNRGSGGPPMMGTSGTGMPSLGGAPGTPPGIPSPSGDGREGRSWGDRRDRERDGRDRGGPGGWNMDGFLEMRYRSYDRNGDGILNYDEMPESLRVERDKFDTNHDGFIDANEYREYARARMMQMQSEREGGSPWGGGQPWVPETPPLEEEEDKKPTVYRADNLPRELPGWFRELDADADAQIGLYEWKNAQRPLDEYMRMDRNNDGFLTVDEVLFFQKHGGTQTVNGRPGFGGPGNFAGFGPPGGMPGRGFGPPGGSPGGGDWRSRFGGGEGGDWRSRFGGGDGGNRPDFRRPGSGSEGGNRPDFRRSGGDNGSNRESRRSGGERERR